jgi:hypothetical protein
MIITILLNLIKIMGISLVIKHFTPIKAMLEALLENIPIETNRTGDTYHMVLTTLHAMLNCVKCISFWVGLCFGLYYAVGAWVILYLIETYKITKQDAD